MGENQVDYARYNKAIYGAVSFCELLKDLSDFEVDLLH